MQYIFLFVLFSVGSCLTFLVLFLVPALFYRLRARIKNVCEPNVYLLIFRHNASYFFDIYRPLLINFLLCFPS